MRHSDQSYYIAGGKPENGSLDYVKIEGNDECASFEAGAGSISNLLERMDKL